MPSAGVTDRVSRARLVLVIAALVAITFAAYGPALRAGFIWDDDSYVTQNPALRNGLDGLASVWVPRVTPQYYPIVFTTFWIEWQLWDGDPLGYHIVNIALHAINAVLLAFVLSRIGAPREAAWMIAFLFALHPVHVESVAWITERKNVLSMSFFLLAALTYLKFDGQRYAAPSDLRSRTEGTAWAWYSLSLILFVCALLSKSVTASLPAAIVLALLFKRERVTFGRLWPLIPLLVLGAAAGLHTGWIERTHVGALGPDWDHSLLERLLIGSRAFLFYPWKVAVPHPLIFVYPRWEIDASHAVQYIPLVACLAAASALLAVWLRWSVRGPFLAFCLYALSIFPALGFANVYPHRFSFVADHFQYHASVGLLALVVMAIVAVVKSFKARIAATVIIAVVCALLTFLQASTYRDAQTLYETTVQRNPDAWMAYTNLSQIHLRRTEAARAAGNMDAALREAATAEAAARSALAVRPQHEPAHINLAEALRLRGEYGESLLQIQHGIASLQAEMQWHFDRGYESKIDFFKQHLARDYALLGRAYELADERARAIEAYCTTIDFGERDSSFLAHDRLARIFVDDQDRWDDAASHFSAMLEVEPGSLDAHLFLAEHARRRGRYAVADRHLQIAAQVIPTPEAERVILYRVAWLLATARDETVRDGEAALANATRLMELGGQTSPDAFDALAAALAELGRFEEASQMAGEALKLTEAYGLEEQGEAIRARKNVYDSGRPYRE